MAFSKKSTHVDRDDYSADHYADFARDSHRTRLTFELLDIARRQHRCKEKLLSQAHSITMKEHARMENDFLKKLQHNTRIANLPVVRKALRAHQRQGLDPSPPPVSSRPAADKTQPTIPGERSAHKETTSRPTTRPPSARTERLNANLEKFGQNNSVLC